jgi:hypothetical protein
VVGGKKIGKSSLIEYLTGYELCLPDSIDIPVKITISNNHRFEKEIANTNSNLLETSLVKYLDLARGDDKFLDDNFEMNSTEKHVFIYCDHFFFKNMKEFHERMLERSYQELTKNKFLEINLFIHEDFNSTFPYDVNLWEVPNEFLVNLNSHEEIKTLLNSENNIFLVVLGYDQVERVDYYTNFLGKYDSKFEKTVFIVNKVYFT